MTQGFSKVINKGKKKTWPTFPLIIEAYIVNNFKQVEEEAEALKGNPFVNLNYRTYDPKKFVAVHYKKAKFSQSYSHARQDLEDKVKNCCNTTRELNPSEQQARDEELLEHSQENVSLQERASTMKKKQWKTQKAKREYEKNKQKEIEDIMSDPKEEGINEMLEQRNVALARKNQELKRKREQELKQSQDSRDQGQLEKKRSLEQELKDKEENLKQEEELKRQQALAEQERNQKEEELKRRKEKKTKGVERGETNKTSELDIEQSELPPLDVPPSTPLTGGHLPLQELGFS